MISTKDLADNNTSISSTRWAFVTVIKFDIVIISVVLIASIIAHFFGKPFDESFFGNVALLLGILTGLATTSKTLQGFETKHMETINTNDKFGK